MIKINLAPEGPVQSPLKNFLAPALICVLVYSIGNYAPTFYVLTIREEIVSVQADSTAKKSQIASLKIDIDAINTLENSVNESKNRSTQIINLRNGHKQAILIADRVQQLHRERMWLSSITFDKFLVKIKGFASDHSVISDYAKQLKAVDDLQSTSISQIDDFEPNFESNTSLKKNETPDLLTAPPKTLLATKNRSALPLKFQDLRIIKSAVTKFDGTSFSEFDLEFKANSP